MIPRGSRDSCPDAILRPFLYTPRAAVQIGQICEAVEEAEIRGVSLFNWLDPKALDPRKSVEVKRLMINWLVVYLAL